MRCQMGLASAILVPALLARLGLCVPADSGAICLGACQNCFQSVHFEGSDGVSPDGLQICQGRLYLSSLYLCLDVHCDAKARDQGLAGLNKTCGTAQNVTLPPLDIVANYTSEDISGMRKMGLGESVDVDDPLREVVIPSTAFFGLWFDTLDAVEYVQSYHYSYGLAMTVFWAAVVAIGMANRILSTVAFLCRPQGNNGTFKHILNRPSNWLRQHVLIPAAFGYRCAQNVWWCTIPSRVQTLTLISFTLINIIFSIHGYRIIPQNLYFPSMSKQVLRYVSDRTGIISFANFPVIWLFGMRNNLALWLTGWDFGTYNNFHRWVARIATLQAVIHSVGYTVLIFKDGGWTYFVSWWTQMFWWAGELATVFMCALLLCSVYWIRRQNYETFLILHIVLSALILVTMLGHVSIFNGQYNGLFWIPVVIWILDRLIRGLRILAFNRKTWQTTGYATYSEYSNIVKLSVPSDQSLYKSRPGTFYYLMVLGGRFSWESHPFTVASVSAGNTWSHKTFDEQAPLLVSDGSEQVDENLDTLLSSDASVMTFLIRPYDSFTSRLRNRAKAEWPRPASLQFLVEGPYGQTLPLAKFDRVVFIVGGSGVVLPLSYMQALTQPKSRCKHIEIHWALREPAFAADVIEHHLGDELQRNNLSLKLYITTSYCGQDQLRDLPSWAERHFTGLDVGGCVVTAARSCDQGCNLAIVACGPAKMADDARRAAAEMVGTNPCHLEYFEESFKW